MVNLVGVKRKGTVKFFGGCLQVGVERGDFEVGLDVFGFHEGGGISYEPKGNRLKGVECFPVGGGAVCPNLGTIT